MSVYFNSRPHEEVDHNAGHEVLETCISTHDLTRRSTECMQKYIRNINISTHDLTRRSTVEQMYRAAWMLTFQLTTSRGGRLRKKLIIYIGSIFQLTTSRGGRHASHFFKTWRTKFQLTTSRGGRRYRHLPFLLRPRYFNSRPHEEVDPSCLRQP